MFFFLGGGASESWVSFLYNASHLHSESCGTSRGKSVHGPDLGPTKKTISRELGKEWRMGKLYQIEVGALLIQF